MLIHLEKLRHLLPDIKSRIDAMGHAFFKHQLPQLIHAIQALTSALDRPAQKVTLPVESDPEFLSELYYGNYEPGIFKSTPKGAELMQKLNDAYDALGETLSEESRDRLDRYLEIAADRSARDYLMQARGLLDSPCGYEFAVRVEGHTALSARGF